MLRDGSRLRLFMKRVLRKICGSRTEKIACDGKKSHNEKLDEL